MEHLNQVIGEKIRMYRKALNMTTTELGRLSETSQSTISQIENGRSTSLDTLIKICEALKISLFDILPDEMIPSLQEDDPAKRQLVGILDELNEHELKTIQTLLTTDLIPTFKAITPLIKAIEDLDENELKIFKKIFYSLTNKK